VTELVWRAIGAAFAALLVIALGAFLALPRPA
jgi:branched-subunit amino acid permease